MSEKQKIPLNKHIDTSKPTGQDPGGKRGIEPEETHRQGGNRVPDQGGAKAPPRGERDHQR